MKPCLGACLNVLIKTQLHRLLKGIRKGGTEEAVLWSIV